MFSRQRVIRHLRRTVFGVPAYGLVLAAFVAGTVFVVSLFTQRWLHVVSEEWQRDRVEQAGHWAIESLTDELKEREILISEMAANWQLSNQQGIDYVNYFKQLHDEQLVTAGYIYDVEIPDMSYQILPQFALPIPEPRQTVLERARLEFGPSRLMASDPDNLWMFIEPEVAELPVAVFAARLDKSRFFLAEYRLSDSLEKLLKDPVNDDIGIGLIYKGTEYFSAKPVSGELENDEDSPSIEFPVLYETVPTNYAVKVRLGRNDRIILLQSLTRIISAGGIMFSLAFGGLVLAWTRSSKRFTLVRRKQRLLHERSPLFYQDVDHRLRIMDVNHTLCEALGYHHDELIGRPLAELLSDGDELLDQMRNHADSEPLLRMGANYRAASGELLPVLITAVGDRDEHGHLHWTIISQDLTEQTRVERISARSQLQVRFLSKVVESLEDGLLVLDELGSVIYANPSATRLADPDYRGLLGRSLNEIFSIPTNIDFWTEIVDHARSNLGWHAEVGLLSHEPDKARLSVRLSGASGRETGGSAIILLVRDLTKEKELSRQLASSQRMYQLIFDKAPTGIIVLDENGSIVGANDFHHELLAPSLALPRGMTSLFDHPALLRAGGREALARLYEGEEVYFEQVPFPGRSGEDIRYLSIRGIPESEGSRAVVTRAFLFIEDITERVEFERRREARTISLEDEKERALEASRLKSQFIATISHELRTPLNAIIGFSQLIAKKSMLDDRQSANLSKIEDSGRKLLRLVNDLLDISRIEAGHMQIHWEPVSLASFLEDIQRQAEPLMEQNNNRIAFDVPTNIGLIDTDAFRLQQILMNLINNAAKFTHNGEIIVMVEARTLAGGEDNVLITVKDSGVGIPQSKLEDIFDEFYQVDGSATRAYGGTGLGLAISRKLAILMHGDISAQSTPGLGSSFCLRLPRVRPSRSATGEQTPLLRQKT